MEDNFEIIRELKQIKAMGYPILLGPSRKSFIGEALDLPVKERLEGTMASITVGITVGTLKNTGATCVNIINDNITNIITRLLSAAIGLSLSALSLASLIDLSLTANCCIINF